MSIYNTGMMGLVFNFAPNYGTQVALAGGGGVGIVYNFSTNFGTQAGILG